MNKKSFPIFFSLILSATILISSCATTGPGGKQSFIIFPVEQEVSIGAGMAEELEKTEKFLPDQEWQDYINRVGQKIVAVSDRKDIEYHFKVIESDQINAFAAPGGFVYFYSGLLREMDNESEMAAVMAHEISHVVARHSVRNIQAALGVSMAYELVFGDEDNKVRDLAIGVGMNLLFAKYSRDYEREADSYGIQYMVKAGYNPNGAVTMFQKLAELGGSGGSGIFEAFSTHPESQERIANAKSQIANMQPLSSSLTTGTTYYQQMRSRFPAKK